jgi:hypothetical protein
LNFDAKELFGYRALINQFSEDHPGHTHTTFFVGPISAKDKISPKEFENAKKVLTSHMVNLKQPKCTPHVTARYILLFFLVFIDKLAQVLTF